MKKDLRQSVLKAYISSPFEAFNHKQIEARIGVHDKASRQEVIRIVQQLAEEGIIVADSHRGRYKVNLAKVPADMLPQHYVEGVVALKPSGKAVVMPKEEGQEDIEIAATHTNHALNGDTVKVLLFPKRKFHEPEGQIVEILQRARTRFVGILQMQKTYAFMASTSRNMPVDIFIPLQDIGGAQNGEKVVVEMTDWPENMNNPVGRVVKRLGKPGENNVEMQSILAEYDFPLDFPDEVMEQVKRMKAPTKKDFANRKDFRDTLTFTIDPADAKDFDDALSLRTLEDGTFEVGVHIADVSHYVKENTPLDREAYERGTSVYLVDRTIGMLPDRLCNDLCSLNEHEDKLTFSVVLTIDDKAKVLNTWIGKTVINSNRRLAYEDAQKVIEQNKAGDDIERAILQLHALASILRKERYKSGAINFESQEVKFKLDENSKPIGVYIKEQKEANWLIEEFMLLANRKVAEAIKNQRPFVFRVHDEPNPEKLNTFVEFVTKLGFKMKVGSRKALADSYNRLFADIAGRGEEYMIESIAIRTMSKAFYSTNNIGHYGLAFPYYTHFTSPIRRYPDLMVHRLLLDFLENKGKADVEVLEERCKHCSLMEKKAADAERTSVKYKQAEYLSEQLGQVFPALISGVSKWGLYAEIEGNKCEGMIPIGSLKDDYYMLDEDNYQVIGRRYGRCYKLGDSVRIKVVRVDMMKKQIDFELVEDNEVKPTAKGGKQNVSNKKKKR